MFAVLLQDHVVDGITDLLSALLLLQQERLLLLRGQLLHHHLLGHVLATHGSDVVVLRVLTIIALVLVAILVHVVAVLVVLVVASVVLASLVGIIAVASTLAVLVVEVVVAHATLVAALVLSATLHLTTINTHATIAHVGRVEVLEEVLLDLLETSVFTLLMQLGARHPVLHVQGSGSEWGGVVELLDGLLGILNILE